MIDDFSIDHLVIDVSTNCQIIDPSSMAQLVVGGAGGIP
jgi:hypothetical protein